MHTLGGCQNREKIFWFHEKKISIPRFFQKYFFEIIILVILEDFDKFDVFAQKFAKVAKFSIWRKKNWLRDFSELFFEIIIFVILEDFDKFDIFAQKFAKFIENLEVRAKRASAAGLAQAAVGGRPGEFL